MDKKEINAVLKKWRKEYPDVQLPPWNRLTFKEYLKSDPLMGVIIASAVLFALGLVTVVIELYGSR
jgi:hypothetical protein